MPFFSRELWNEADAGRFPALDCLFKMTKGCTSERFWEYEDAFEAFFKSNFVPTFLANQVSKIATDHDYDGIQSDDEVELVRGEGFRISMGKIKATSPLAINYSEVVCYASDFMYANLGPSPLEIEFFNFPSDHDNTCFDRTVQPVFSGRRLQYPGDIVKARAGIDVLKVSPPGSDTFQIYAVSLKPKMSLLWHFDAVTLLAKYCTSANLMSSRIQTGIDILVRMNCKRAVPEMIGATRSRDHFVRWAAIVGVACLDECRGVELLRKALEDPHPDIRCAAEQALAKLVPKH